ncbi:MAG: formylglycine-generating enzyme family protein [Paludibacteraceae bacterium]|nr:formylglycine-generating enzyme family protein [Paludibacteraceae bacterium]
MQTTTQNNRYSGEKRTFTANGVSFTMVYVQGGTFTMGATSEQGSDAASYEKPTHSVTLSSFSIGETEVTQALWEAVMGESVTLIANRNGWNTCGVGSNYPMYYISWNDCQTFINKLNSLTGKNFRLPTEAEWEFAARGGNKSKGYKYSGSNNLGDVAWYWDNSKINGTIQTHPVKQKQANELGIYDMSGNVCEWCQDWHGSYSSSSLTDPKGPSGGSHRESRGGSCLGSARDCRSSDRLGCFPADNWSFTLGLRLALSE